MASNPHAIAALDRFSPYSHQALQNFVMAMTDVVKNTGKKSLFGRDKGADAYEKFILSLLRVVKGMGADGQIQESSTPDEILEKLVILMGLFRDGYPNWPEAYLYFTWLISDNRQQLLILLAHARNSL